MSRQESKQRRVHSRDTSEDTDITDAPQGHPKTLDFPSQEYPVSPYPLLQRGARGHPEGQMEVLHTASSSFLSEPPDRTTALSIPSDEVAPIPSPVSVDSRTDPSSGLLHQPPTAKSSPTNQVDRLNAADVALQAAHDFLDTVAEVDSAGARSEYSRDATIKSTLSSPDHSSLDRRFDYVVNRLGTSSDLASRYFAEQNVSPDQRRVNIEDIPARLSSLRQSRSTHLIDYNGNQQRAEKMSNVSRSAHPQDVGTSGLAFTWNSDTSSLRETKLPMGQADLRDEQPVTPESEELVRPSQDCSADSKAGAEPISAQDLPDAR